MRSIITSKTIESDYFGILAFLTGGIALIPWYYWIGKTVSRLGAGRLGNRATIIASVLVYFLWNEAFRRKWNQIEHVAGQQELKAGPIWTVLLGPIYLNFKINQAKGTER